MQFILANSYKSFGVMRLFQQFVCSLQCRLQVLKQCIPLLLLH